MNVQRQYICICVYRNNNTGEKTFSKTSCLPVPICFRTHAQLARFADLILGSACGYTGRCSLISTLLQRGCRELFASHDKYHYITITGIANIKQMKRRMWFAALGSFAELGCMSPPVETCGKRTQAPNGVAANASQFLSGVLPLNSLCPLHLTKAAACDRVHGQLP